MTDKPEVHQVWVDIELPSSRCPTGRTAFGFYTVTDGTVTMTDPRGKAAEDAEGKIYSHKLEANDDAHVVAGRLTKQLRSALRGDRPKGFGGSGSGFNGPLNYNNRGIV
jgi:hypothetical protein